MNTDRRDRVLDWREELFGLEPDFAALPEAARNAVQATVARFLSEDTEEDGASGPQGVCGLGGAA